MQKTGFRILPLLLIATFLLPLFLSACMPGDAADTTPAPVTDITTPPAISTPEETTEPTETQRPPRPQSTDEHGAPATYPARPLYEDFVQNRMDPEMRDEVYELIRTADWSAAIAGGSYFDELYDQYLKFEPLGKKAVPYILMYIEEEKAPGYFNMCFVVVAARLLGYKSTTSISHKYGPPKDTAEYWAWTPEWYAQQLWEEVFTP